MYTLFLYHKIVKLSNSFFLKVFFSMRIIVGRMKLGKNKDFRFTVILIEDKQDTKLVQHTSVQHFSEAGATTWWIEAN